MDATLKMTVAWQVSVDGGGVRLTRVGGTVFPRLPKPDGGEEDWSSTTKGVITDEQPSAVQPAKSAPLASPFGSSAQVDAVAAAFRPSTQPLKFGQSAGERGNSGMQNSVNTSVNSIQEAFSVSCVQPSMWFHTTPSMAIRICQHDVLPQYCHTQKVKVQSKTVQLALPAARLCSVVVNMLDFEKNLSSTLGGPLFFSVSFPCES